MDEQLQWGEYYKDTKTGQIVRYCPLHSGQQAILDAHEKRFLFYCSGKGAGKSSFAPIWLHKELEKVQGRGSFIICAPTYGVLEQGVLPEFYKTMKYSPYAGTFCGRPRNVYTTAQGGRIYIRSLDDPEKVNGIHADAIVVDEGFMLGKEAWTILESRVAQKKGRILVTSTPYRKFRWPLELLERYQKKDKDIFFLQVSSNVNPGFQQDEFERLQKTTDRWRFEQDYCGLFSQPQGIIYPDMKSCVVDPQPLPLGDIVAGIDVGHGGEPSAAIVGVLDEQDTFWAFWEYYVRSDPKTGQGSFLQLAKDLTTWSHNFQQATGRTVSRWYTDSATDTCRSLRNFHIEGMPSINARPVKKGAGSVEYGIDVVDSFIRSSRLKLVRGPIKALLEEAELYRWDKNEDDDSPPVIKGPDHALDALRYVLMSISRKRQWSSG